MKSLTILLLLIVVAGCNRHRNNLQERNRKIGIHAFTGTNVNKQSTSWYYIRDVNKAGARGYYFESEKPVGDFTQANFQYYDNVPENFMIELHSKEKIILVPPDSLPANIFQKKDELESVSVRE